MTARMLLRPLLLGLALACTAACGAPARGGSVPRTTSAPVEPHATTPTLDELRTREAAVPIKDYRVRAADGAIELHVKASAPPTVKSKKRPDGVAYSMVDFAIGGDTDVTCQANAVPLDLAHWVEAIITEIHAKLTEAPTVEVEVVEGHPLLLVHTEAIVEVGGVAKRHVAKFAAAHLDRGSVACVHDGVGYETTFRDVARHVVAASRTPEVERPSLRAIALERDGERVVGFEELRVYRGAKPGESRQMTLSSAVLTHNDGWTTADGGWFGLVDGRGVVTERSMRRFGARTTLDMTLDRRSAGVFTYKGTVDGEAKSGSFKSREALVTRVSRAPAMAAFARSSRRELGVVHFDEEAPTSALRTVVRHEGAGQLVLIEGGKSYHCVVDDQGLCTKTWRDGSTWTAQRVYVSGSP